LQYENPSILYACGAFFTLLYAMNLILMFALCGGCSGPVKCYFKMFTIFPVNFIFLSAMALCMGVCVGFITVQYKVESVLCVFLISAALIVALTIYAVRMRGDVTGMGMYVFAAIVCLILTGIVASFFPGEISRKLMGGLGSLVFAFIIVYDTQMIFGSAPFSGGPRKFEYTIDMYAFAAYNLYLDYINFLIYMLQLFGERR